MNLVFLGAYWAQRPESREACAIRIAGFLTAIEPIDSSLSTWFVKGRSRRDADTRIDVTVESISRLLKTNNRDITNEAIVELGFNFSSWNGSAVSVAATLGANHAQTKNNVVVETSSEFSDLVWRKLAELAISSFDPDLLIVSNGIGSPLFKFER